jgi:hypothetical protein
LNHGSSESWTGFFFLLNTITEGRRPNQPALAIIPIVAIARQKNNNGQMTPGADTVQRRQAVDLRTETIQGQID